MKGNDAKAPDLFSNASLLSMLSRSQSSRSSTNRASASSSSQDRSSRKKIEKETPTPSVMSSRRSSPSSGRYRPKELTERISNGPNIYQIGAEIGRGASAVVYQAFNVETGDFVAVKRFPLTAIDDDSLGSIQGEIELMQRLNHPNIVKYIDTIRTERYLYIVIEYIENGSLSTVLKKFGSFSESLVAIYVKQILRGLKYLHEQGALHRDIKGANILTTKDGHVKLADFGVAIKLTEASSSKKKNVQEDSQDVVGSPYWIAPEIIEMATPTAACDIWSVGCTVIELLTGKPPYYNRAPMAALFSIVQDDHPPLPDGISQKIKDFLLLCFEKDPSVRSTAAVLLSHPWLQQPAQLHTTPRTSKSPPMTRSFSTSLVSSPEFTHRENFREKQLGESRCASAESSPTLAERSNRNGDRAYFSDNISPRFALDTSSKDERSPKEDTLSNVSEASLNSEQKENTVERALLLREAALIKISVSVEEDVEDVVVANLPLPVVEELSVRFPEGLSDPNILSSAQRNAFSRMRMQSFQIPEDHGSSRSDWSSSCETSDFNLPDLRPWSMPDNRTGDLLNDSVSRVPPMLHEREVSLITSSYSSVKRVHGVPPAFNPSMYTNTDTPVKTVTSDNNTPGSGPGKLVKSDSLSRVPPMLHDREVSSITISYSAMKPYQSVQSFPSNTYNNINTTSNFNTLNSTDTTINTNNNNNPFINLNPSNSSYLSSNTATDSMVRDEREREAVVTNATWGTTATHDALSDELSDAYADNLDDNLFTGTPLSLDDEVDERRGLNILRKALKSASFLDLDTEVSPVGSEDISETEGRGSLPLPPPPLVLSLKKPTEAYGDRGNRNGDTSSTDIRVRILGGSHHRNNSIDGLPIDDVHSMRLDDDDDLDRTESRDLDMNRSKEIVAIMGTITPLCSRKDAVMKCKKLLTIFSLYPDIKDHLITHFGVTPILEMFEATQQNQLARGSAYNSMNFEQNHSRSSSVSTESSSMTAPSGSCEFTVDVLRVVNKIMEGSARSQEQLTMMGILPGILRLLEDSSKAVTAMKEHEKSLSSLTDRPPSYTSMAFSNFLPQSLISTAQHPTIDTRKDQLEVDPSAMEAARFIHLISSASSLTLQILVGAGGLSALVHMISFSALMSSDRDITQRKENGQLSWARDLNSMIPTENIPSSASCSGVTTTTTESNETMSSQKKSFFSSMTPYTTSPHTTTAVPTVGSNPVLENVYPPNNPVTVQTSQTGQSGYRVDPFSEESRGVQGSIPGVSDFNRSQPTTPYELNSVSDDAKLMVYMGVDCVLEIFSVQSSRTRDFCRLFVKIGLLRHISLAFDCIYMLLNRSTPCCSPGCWIDKTQKLKYGSVNTLSNSNLNLNSNTNCSLISRCPSKNGHERTPSNVSDYDLNSKPDDVHSIQECRYLNSIASIFLKFSRSDATVALHMAGDTAVIQCIMTVLKDPRLRTPTPTPMSSTAAAAAAGAGAGATTATSFGTGTGTASASAMNYDSVTSAGSVDTKNSSLSATTNTNTNTINIEKKGFLGLSALGMSRCTLGIIETLLKCLKNLSMESSALADLEKAGTIPMLISLLGGPVSHRCKNHIVPCIFNLCRINKRRQEDAAMHGLIPHLQSLIANDSHLKQFALPILCSLAYTSAKTRLELVKHGGAAFYINLLKESYWQTFALNSLAVWLANDTDYVENLLVEPAHLTRLVDFFRTASPQIIRVLHKPFLDMMVKSSILSKALSNSGLYVTSLVKRLCTSDAIVLRSLLKMVQLLHQYHPNPRQFVLDNDLYNVAKGFAQSEGQVLVHQIANRLLIDFQNSTLT